MKFTQEEQAILDGAEGPGIAKALAYQVALGDSFDVARMVEVGRGLLGANMWQKGANYGH